MQFYDCTFRIKLIMGEPVSSLGIFAFMYVDSRKEFPHSFDSHSENSSIVCWEYDAFEWASPSFSNHFIPTQLVL